MTDNAHLEAEEYELLDSYQRDEWQSVPALQEQRRQYQAYATATLEAEGLISIILSGDDLQAVRQQAAESGLSTTTFITDIVHQFVSGHLVPKLHD